MNQSALELFRNACGLSVPLALECEEAGGSTPGSDIHQCEYPFLLIGRDPKSDLVLDHAEISRRHTFLQAIAGRILVVDLHSRTKVFWDGEEAPRSKGWLSPNGFIQIGPYRIRRAGSSPSHDQQAEFPVPSSRLGQEPSGAGSIAHAALELPIRMSEGPSLWPLGGQLVLVGRSAECELVLSDENVSRFHAALVPTPSGVWVVDLLAREGVHVNSQRVRWAWLADGDSLRMGSFTFILRYETPPDQITRRDVPLEAGATVVERPRTELAIRAGTPDDERRSLTLGRGGRSSVRLKATGSSHPLEPAAVVPFSAGAWDSSIPFPPSPMAMWQQQMQLMESFHNDMILMVQMFVAMHREHLASVRNELDMVQKLTGELSGLQAKLAHRPGAADMGPTADGGRPSQEQRPLQGIDHKKREKKARQPTDTRQRAEPTAPQSTGPASVGRPKSRSGEESASSGYQDTSEGEGSQIHSVLTQRIAELQRERQGYWQRILSALHG
jgi:pSer/pThr/pTyr-binding forkhead associated (FHA) protein